MTEKGSPKKDPQTRISHSLLIYVGSGVSAEYLLVCGVGWDQLVN